jgi:hypothetical protein
LEYEKHLHDLHKRRYDDSGTVLERQMDVKVQTAGRKMQHLDELELEKEQYDGGSCCSMACYHLEYYSFQHARL